MPSAVDYIKPGESSLMKRLETEEEGKVFRAVITLETGVVTQEVVQDFIAKSDKKALNAVKDWRFDISIYRVPAWQLENPGTVRRYKLVPCEDEEQETQNG